MPGAPAKSLSTTEYKTLVAGTPRVSHCCVEIHNLLEFCTGGQPSVTPISQLPVVPWNGKGDFTGAGECGRGSEET